MGHNSFGILSNNLVTASTIICNADTRYGVICGYNASPGKLTNNYYYACTVNGAANATDVGCDGHDFNTEFCPCGAVPAIALLDNANNTMAITNAADGNAHRVVLYGRTLYKDGAWNTLCLPFALTDGDTDPEVILVESGKRKVERV